MASSRTVTLPLRSLARGILARPGSSPLIPFVLPGSYIPVRLLPSPCTPQVRHSSHSPLGAAPVNPRKKVTMQTLRSLYKKGEPITMLTAHDFPSGHVADVAGMEMILVGDSLAMVALGMEDTSQVLMDEMLLHCRSVARAAKSAFTVRKPCWRLGVCCVQGLADAHIPRLRISPWARMKCRRNRLCNRPFAW
jgi:3-methyl-2-oxobutanoate hydroxymethyltransferase